MSVSADRLESVFIAASELPEAERSAYLDKACGSDPELRGAVEKMLAAHADPARIFDRLRPSLPPTGFHAALPDTGTILAGRYKLLEQIGEGGMGAVWMARQTEPIKRTVAVKLIKPGMDSKQVLARFEAERQALALMDHANIARVFDAGVTSDGRPFFVMELVKGEPITQFCDSRRLTLKERLELFVPVCLAIQHAHQKGVIHRDIKPSNVLVSMYDDRPIPKVIDFGVAKAIGQPLTDQTLHTGFGTVVGTPQYMSPEQATFNNLDIDTRSDVYSLGALLYELLAGSPPFTRKELEKAGLMEVLRVVREEEPPRPSTKLSTADALPTLAAKRNTEPAKLAGLLRSELDWIVMKSLEKDRTRRYETANGFAADVQRYLAGESVQAVPPSNLYRLRKVVRKHKGPIAAALILTIAVIGALAGAAYGVVEAENRRQANSLREEAESARQAAELAWAGEARQRGDAETARKAAETALVGEAREHASAENARKAAEKAHAELARVRSRSAWSEYGRAIQTAHQDWSSNNVPKALSLLNGTREDLRGWEWNYVNRLCNKQLATLKGHSDIVYSASFSPDGKSAVTTSRDGTARVWDTETGAELALLNGHTGFVYSASFSPDGKRVLTTSADRTARVWDVATGNTLVILKGHTGSVYSASFSPDGKRVLTAAPEGAEPVWGSARVWDAESGVQLALLEDRKSAISTARFSPDGKRVVSNDWRALETTVQVWDAATGEILASLKGHREKVYSAVFSSDGKRVLTASADQTARLWDAISGAELVSFRGHTNTVHDASFSPDDRRVVTASYDSTARVWDAAAGRELAICKGHTGSVGAGAFSPDGKRVLTASVDLETTVWQREIVWSNSDATARVWDAGSGTEILALKGHAKGIRLAAFSPDGKRVITTSDDQTARIWDAEPQPEPTVIDASHALMEGASLRADGKRILVWNTTPEMWDVMNPKMIRSFNHIAKWASFSPDGKRVVTTSNDRTAKVWDAESGAELAILSHSYPVNTAAFSRDGLQLLTASNDRTARIWDIASKTTIATFEGHKSYLHFASFSPDEKRVVTASQDHTARVWDVASRTTVATLTGHTSQVNSAVFSGDGKWVLTASVDQTARIWDATSGAELLVLRGHTGSLDLAVFSRDDKRVLTASADRTARLWEPIFGTELAVLKAHHDAVISALFGPNDEEVFTASMDGTIRIWRSGPDLTQISRCREAVRREPGNFQAHANLAVALFYSGDSYGSIAIFREALRLNPMYARGHPNIKSCLQRIGNGTANNDFAKMNKLIEVLAELTAEFPNHDTYPLSASLYCRNLGDAAFREGKHADALASYRRAATFLDSMTLAFPTMTDMTLSELCGRRLSLVQSFEKLKNEPETKAAYLQALVAAEAIVARNQGLKEPGRVGAPDQVIRLYKRFEPKTALAHATLGQALQHKGDLEDAMARFRESIRLDPKMNVSHRALDRILVEQADRDKTEAMYRKTLSVADELSNSFPAIVRYRSTSAKLHNELGKMYQILGKPVEAVAEFGKAANALEKLDNDLPDELDDRFQLARRHRDLADSFRRLNRQTEAIADYQRASRVLSDLIVRHPAEGQYRNELIKIGYEAGNYCKDIGKPGAAEEHYRLITRFAPHDPWGHANLGIVVSARGGYPEAIACYAEAVRLDTSNSQLRREQAMMLRGGGEKKRAVEAAQEAVRVGPQDMWAFNELGLALRDVGDLDGAIAAFQKAIAIDPKLPYFHEMLSQLFASSIEQRRPVADYRKPLTAVKELIAKFPDRFEYRVIEAGIHTRMGDLLIEQAKPQEALVEYDLSRELLQSLVFRKPDSQDFRRALNRIRFKLGEPATELRLTALNNGAIYRISFSPDGRWCLAAGDMGVRSPVQIYSAQSGELVRSFLPDEDWGWSDARFTSDGSRLVAWGSKGVALYVWDMVGDKRVCKLEGHTKPVAYADFSPDGKSIVSGSSDRSLRVWNAATGRELRLLEGHEDTCAGLFCQGDRIISYSLDKTIRGWDAATGRQLWKQSNQSAINSTALFAIGDRCLSEDGSRMMSCADDGSMHIWETTTGKPIVRVAGPSAAVGAVFVNGGSRLAAWGKDRWLRVWSLPDGKSTTDLSLGGDLLNEPDNVTVSPDGRTVLTGHKNQIVKVRDLVSGQTHEFAVEPGISTRSLAFSPNSRQAAAGSFRGWIYLWNMPSRGKDQ